MFGVICSVLGGHRERYIWLLCGFQGVLKRDHEVSKGLPAILATCLWSGRVFENPRKFAALDPASNSLACCNVFGNHVPGVITQCVCRSLQCVPGVGKTPFLAPKRFLEVNSESVISTKCLSLHNMFVRSLCYVSLVPKLLYVLHCVFLGIIAKYLCSVFRIPAAYPGACSAFPRNTSNRAVRMEGSS